MAAEYYTGMALQYLYDGEHSLETDRGILNETHSKLVSRVLAAFYSEESMLLLRCDVHGYAEGAGRDALEVMPHESHLRQGYARIKARQNMWPEPVHHALRPQWTGTFTLRPGHGLDNALKDEEMVIAWPSVQDEHFLKHDEWISHLLSDIVTELSCTN